MKKWLASLVALMLVFVLAIPVQADSKGISVYYNGEELDLVEPAFIEKGKTYIPLRSYMEELGYEVRYKGAKKQIILEWYGYESIIDLNTQEVTEEDEVVIEKLDVLYRNNTYYAPIRELEPVTVTTTTWDRATNSVYVADKYYAVPEVNAPSEGFLWKVTKGENTVYMLGSIHVGKEDLYPLRDEINAAYEASDIVITEIDINGEPSAEEEAEIEKLLTYQDGTQLRDHLSEDTYEELMKLANKLGIRGEGLKELQNYRVWFVNLIFSNLDQAAADSSLGIDQYFLDRAAEDNLPNGELESFLSQYEMLASFSDEFQEEMLIETIMTYEYAFAGYDVGAGTDQLLRIWAEGNLEALTEMADATKEYSLEYYDAMLTNRNEGMTDKIEQYLNDTEHKTYFVIAGALHFAGDDSIIAMLEKRGYTVERL